MSFLKRNAFFLVSHATEFPEVVALRTRTGVDALGDDRRMEDQELLMLLMELNETVEDGTLSEATARNA